MLNRNEIKYLKKYSHSLKPVFQIGKNGESREQLQSILEYLNLYEIVKVSILNNAPEDKKYYATLFQDAGIEVVYVIGRTITLYRYSHYPEKKSSIKLP